MRRPSFLFGCKIRPGKARVSFGEKHISGGFRFGTRGLSVLFGSAGKKSETSEHKPNFGNITAGRGRLKQGVWSVDLGFSPHFRKRPTEVCGKFWNPRAHCPFHEKKPQVEALPLFSVVCISTICRILPEFVQARLGCLSFGSDESCPDLIICIQIVTLNL